MWPFKKKAESTVEPEAAKEPKKLPDPRVDLGIVVEDGCHWVSVRSWAPYYGAMVGVSPAQTRRLAKAMCDLADTAERMDATPGPQKPVAPDAGGEAT